MTKHELRIKACMYAIADLKENGSHAFGAKDKATGKFETIEWNEVLEWLNEELERAEVLKTM